VVPGRRLGTDVESGVRPLHILDVQHQYVRHSVGAEPGQVVRARAVAGARHAPRSGRLQSTDDGRDAEVDVPVITASHPVVVRQTLQVETAAHFRYCVVRGPHAHHIYAEAACIHTRQS